MHAEHRKLFGNMLRAGALAGLFALLGSLMVSLTWEETRDVIAENQRRVLLDTLNQLVPVARYDNDLFTDTASFADEEMLGSDSPVTVYRARRNGEPVAALLTPVAPNGYSGDIRLLVGINYDGSLAGVRVLEHKETPGLGDLVEASKSDWLDQFDNASLASPPIDRWKVEKDGGAFDQLTGATITPRAIVQAVKQALMFYNAHREAIYAREADAEDDTAKEAE